MPLSFTLHETMKGLHHFTDPDYGDSKDRPITFELDWGGPLPSNILPTSPNFFAFEASGTIDVSKLTPSPTPCRGSLRLDYFETHTLAYHLEFQVEETPYTFTGEKIDVKLWHPIQLIKTHTTCYGAIAREDGTVVSRSVLHFPLSEMVSFLASFRLHWK